MRSFVSRSLHGGVVPVNVRREWLQIVLLGEFADYGTLFGSCGYEGGVAGGTVLFVLERDASAVTTRQCIVRAPIAAREK